MRTPRSINIVIVTGICVSVYLPVVFGQSAGSIYHDGWIDLNKNGRMDPYENPKLDIEKRIDDLLGRMTMEEKTCQMVTLYGFGYVTNDELPTEDWPKSLWKDGLANIDQHLSSETKTEYAWPPSKHAEALNTVQRFFIEKTRLGIPVDFTTEGIHGVYHQGATCYPVPIGIGSTWNPKLVEALGTATAKEARALGYTHIYAPICDLAIDPRWGRGFACYSEDPYLASRLAVVMARSMQAGGIASTGKHFGVYSVPKGARDGDARTDPKVAPREVEWLHNAPFKAAITEGGMMGVMASMNDYDGVPLVANKKFLVDKLRGEWGMKGYVVSDSKAVYHVSAKHATADTYKEAVRQAVEGGLNVRTAFSAPDLYVNPLRELIKEGKLSMKTIDERVRPVLRLKYILGLFDRPYVENTKAGDSVIHCQAHQDLAREIARQSIVLLKNDGNVLPLSKNLKRILVTGPNADEGGLEVLGRYGPLHARMVTVLEGIKSKVSADTEVIYVKGCELVDSRWPESEILPEPPGAKERAEIDRAAKQAEKSDVAVVVLGGSEEKTCGETRSRVSLDLPGYQLDLVKAVYETGTPTVVVLINGRALTINWVDKYVPSIVEAWYSGEKGGLAIADVLFGDYNPGGKLSVTFPKTVGQVLFNFPYKPGSHRDGSARVGGVIYPFGHGLSFTKFEYTNLKISPLQQKADGNITVTVDVRNIGDIKGDEVVQLYINDRASSVTTPVRVLRGFERVTLEAGEKKTVRFVLKPKDLQILDINMEWTVEPGWFDVYVGSSSEDIKLQDSFEIVG